MLRVRRGPPHEGCPTCGREFGRLTDYPTVQVLDFERLPLPEAIDTQSAAAGRLQTQALRLGKADLDIGVNVTPQIAVACAQDRVQDFLDRLAALVGTKIDPRELHPSWDAHGYFRFAYPLTERSVEERSEQRIRLYLAVAEPDPDDDDACATSDGSRFAHVTVYGDGINFGSAGGPTLQRLGIIARFRYRGLLNQQPQSDQ